MNSKEISIWLNEYRLEALEAALAQEHSNIEEHLTQYVVDLYNQMVPAGQFQEIENKIRMESEKEAKEAEANRRFSLAYVTRNGETTIQLLERGEDLFSTAQRLRRHLRGESAFPELYPAAAELTRGRAEQYTAEAVNGSPRVVGVYDVDLDKGELSALDINYGWRTYQVKEISTAIYFAARNQVLDWKLKREQFFQRMEGKELPDSARPVLIRGEQPLPVSKLSFSEEVVQMERTLNFYVPVYFDPDVVFGTDVNTDQNEDWLNVYANYDLEDGRVCDTLEVYLVRAGGSELSCEYRLSAEEQAALLPKMDAYCKEQMGISLEEARAQYLEEEQLHPQMNQTM